MKIVWVTNIILPFPAQYFNLAGSSFGGWLNSSLKEFQNQKEIEIAVCTLYEGAELKKCQQDNIAYYLIPGVLNGRYDDKLEKYCAFIMDELKPDIIHLHGSEFPHGLAFIRCKGNARVVLSIQGIVSVIARSYLAGLGRRQILKNITFRDIIRNDNLFQQKRKFEIRGKFEKQIISEVDAVIGRTEWDKSVVASINKYAKYYVNNETLRDNFYNNEWKIDKMQRHSIYISQAGYPLKGLHILLQALSIVKEYYPDVKVYVAGPNVIKQDTLVDKIKLSGYGKILLNLIEEYHLESNIEFVGMLNEEQCVKRMLDSHIVIVPSVLENSSNSLGEAMLLGVPTISSYVGGMPSMIEENVDGLMYSCYDYEVLAFKILQMFNNEVLCLKLSKNAREKARIRHDKALNFEVLKDIYREILFEKEG